MAHVDAGKTTVTEEFLYHSGAKKTLGNVDKGTTTTDSLSLERERGITIKSSTVSFDWNGMKINLIDTPGHMDFIAEVERTFSVLDGVVLVISAKEGVQPQTRTLFARLKKMNLPIIIFLNKIDRLGVNLDEIRKQIQQELTKDCIYLQEVYENEAYELKIKEHTLDEEFITSQLMMFSEKLYEAYFQESELVHADVCKEELYQVVQGSRAYPVYYGSALKNIGIEALLDGIVDWFRPAMNPCCISSSDESISIQEQLDQLTEELSAYVYKIEWLGKNHRKVYVRLYSGALWFKQRVPVYGTDSTLTVNMYCALENGKEVKADFITPGDICVMYGANGLKCGQWLGKPTTRKGLNQELNPLLSVQVRPHNPEKRVEVLDALYELDIEDPYLQMSNNENCITLRLFGRLQKDMIEAMLMERYQLSLDFDEVETVKKEWPKKKVMAGIGMGESFDDAARALFIVPFNKYAAGITISLEPLAAGSGIVYESEVSYGELEKSFQNAVKEGVIRGLQEGLGHEVIDTKVVFVDMQYDSVSSTPADYRTLASMVVMRALDLSGVHRIQPYMKYEARVPLGFEKYITAKLCEIKAVIMTSEFTQSEANYRGEVALEDVKDFALDIKMYTEGKGSFELEFLEYR